MCNIFEAWQNYQDTKTLKPSSLKRESNRFNRYLGSYWKGKELRTINVRDILAFKKHLFDLNLSPQSVKLCLSLLRRIMRRAVQLELYSGVIPYFEMPNIDNKRIRFFSEEEADNLLFALSKKSELWHDITLFALLTGLRASEIFSLRPSSVNFSLQHLVLYETKNAQTRIVPLNEVAFMLVCKYLNLKMKYLFSEKLIESVSPVFRKTVNELNLNSFAQNNRDKLVFHSLRHTFASWLVQKGVPLMVIAQLLGHKGLQMTLRYAHLAPEQGKSAVNLLSSSITHYMVSREK